MDAVTITRQQFEALTEGFAFLKVASDAGVFDHLSDMAQIALVAAGQAATPEFQAMVLEAAAQ